MVCIVSITTRILSHVYDYVATTFTKVVDIQNKYTVLRQGVQPTGCSDTIKGP